MRRGSKGVREGEGGKHKDFSLVAQVPEQVVKVARITNLLQGRLWHYSSTIGSGITSFFISNLLMYYRLRHY